MDTISITDLEIFAYHGVLEEEKKLGQKFLISLQLSLCVRKAGVNDELGSTVNYADICNLVSDIFGAKSYDLIESCAEVIADAILLKYQMVKEIVVEIKKPWAPIGCIVNYVSVKIKRGWSTAFLGLGSNMGDKNKNIVKALELISDSRNVIISKSSSYITSPVGGVEQDDFLNCCVELKTLLTAEELLVHVLEVENKLKRVRTVHWGPRTIDIDILLFNHEIYENEDLIIPHPRLHERMFVLKPLCEMKANYVHPVLHKRLQELKDKLEKEQLEGIKSLEIITLAD